MLVQTGGGPGQFVNLRTVLGVLPFDPEAQCSQVRQAVGVRRLGRSAVFEQPDAADPIETGGDGLHFDGRVPPPRIFRVRGVERDVVETVEGCLLYTSPSPRDGL